MNKREAKRLAEEDTTAYAVFARGRVGASMSTVTGYRNALIVRKSNGAGAVILTESEIEKVRGGWRP
jgi:hypothetical protein